MTTSEIKNKLEEILDYMNDNYSQESDNDNYNVFEGSKPEVFKYSEHIAISTWGCGAIVCIGSILYFLQEDDGNWFITDDGDRRTGLQDSFSIGWVDSFTEALLRLKKYTEENGTPVYYEGIEPKTICHYTL
jgi:hypothetical protein